MYVRFTLSLMRMSDPWPLSREQILDAVLNRVWCRGRAHIQYIQYAFLPHRSKTDRTVGIGYKLQKIPC